MVCFDIILKVQDISVIVRSAPTDSLSWQGPGLYFGTSLAPNKKAGDKMLIETWFIGLSLVGLVLGVYIYRRVYRLKNRGASPSELTMQSGWDQWMEGKGRLSREDRQIVELIRQVLSESAIEDIRKELLKLEVTSKNARKPLIPLRTAFMDAADTSVLNQTIMKLDDRTRKQVREKLGDLYTDEILLWGYLAKGLTCRILRWYTSVKYDDTASGDWFDSYLKICRQRAANIVDIIRQWKPDGNETGGLHEVISRMDEKRGLDRIRQQFLEVPKGTSIVQDRVEGAEGEPDCWTW
jgi:hypothetical protein